LHIKDKILKLGMRIMEVWNGRYVHWILPLFINGSLDGNWHRRRTHV